MSSVEDRLQPAAAAARARIASPLSELQRREQIDALECAWRGMLTRPDSQVIDEQDWFQVTTPTIAESFLNGVYITDIEDPATAIARVRQAAARYRELGVPFRWVVGPRTRPENFREILTSLGLRPAYAMKGVTADPQTLSITVPKGIELSVAGPAQAREWCRASVLGWEDNESLVDGMAIDIARIMTEQSNGQPDEYGYILARVNGLAVGTASIRVMEGPWGDFGHFIGASVLPDYRGRGVFRALNEGRLAWLRKRGIRLATGHAVESTSAPIYEATGFSMLTRMVMWESG